MPDKTTDIALIGAGPIGLELAVALKKSNFDYLHFDARQIGHTISWFAPQTRFFSSNDRIAIAGIPLFTPDQTKSTREQYLAYLRAIVQQFDLKIRTYEPVTDIKRDHDTFIITTHPSTGPQQYRARRIILATGGTERPRRLGIEGEDLPHVSHYFQDPHDYFQKRLLIIGGRNSAVEAALRSYHCGAKVTISYRKEKLDAASLKYWLTPEMNGLIESKKITAHYQTRATKITPSHVTLARPDNTTQEIEADFVLALIGYEADMKLCKLAGIELIGPGQIPRYNDATMETNIPSIYIAGTAIAGTQEKYAVFIENCHIHVTRIVAALKGESAPKIKIDFDRPES